MLTVKAPYLSQQAVVEVIIGKGNYYFYFLEIINRNVLFLMKKKSYKHFY